MLSGMNTLETAKQNVLTARAMFATVDALVASECPVEPADYCTNDDASLAYEVACDAIATQHDLDGARRLAHAAEENLLDLTFFELSKAESALAVFGAADIALVWEKLPVMRKSYATRAKLVELALSLKM